MRLTLELVQERACLGRIPIDQTVGKLQLDGERDKLLLRAVVDVALEPSPLGVLRRDQPLLRGLQVVEPRPERLREADVPKDEPGL